MQVPYILKLTAEDQSIAVEFVAASVSGATYAVTATPTGIYLRTERGLEEPWLFLR